MNDWPFARSEGESARQVIRREMANVERPGSAAVSGAARFKENGHRDGPDARAILRLVDSLSS